MTTKSRTVMRSVKGVAVLTLLVFSALFYLQFGLQALFQSLSHSSSGASLYPSSPE